MDKIYSRWGRRPRIPKIMKVGGLSNKNKLFISIIIITIIAIVTARNIIEAIHPVLETQSNVLAKAETIKLANESVRKVMENKTYADLCSVEKDSNRKY